ncbi:MULTISPECIES: hypothetical protein [Enterobacterales]|nr:MULTISPECIES: hypothetical protein [Enterobacteriaceae]
MQSLSEQLRRLSKG